MKEFLVIYIDAITPFFVGVVLYFFPHKLTDKDLNREGYLPLLRKFKFSGFILMVLGLIILFVKSAHGTGGGPWF